MEYTKSKIKLGWIYTEAAMEKQAIEKPAEEPGASSDAFSGPVSAAAASSSGPVSAAAVIYIIILLTIILFLF